MNQLFLYKFSRMDLEQFAMFEENYSCEVNEVEFQTDAQFSFDKSNNVLCSKIIVYMLQDTKPLVKAELRSFFNIKQESIEQIRKDDKITFTPALLVQFASLCYGSMRGVLFTKTMGTPMNSFILPPTYFGNIIDKSFVVEV